MSLEAMYSALYRLFYKRGSRDVLQQLRIPPVPGLTEAEQHELGISCGGRFEQVVQLHAQDIGHQWYMPRVPATWGALPVALECDESEVVYRFAESDEFELRIDDDADGRALAAWVDNLRKRKNLHAPWLPDLLRYELLLGAKWRDETTPRVEGFDWDVVGIREALLDQGLFPTDEEPRKYAALFHRDEDGVSEAPLNREQAKAMRTLLAGGDVSAFSSGTLKKCRKLLGGMNMHGKSQPQ
jgi:hypothetical protein